MANIANNTYLFYGDRTELVKCHEKLNELYEKVGNNTVCVDLTVENVQLLTVNGLITLKSLVNMMIHSRWKLRVSGMVIQYTGIIG